MLWHAEFWIGTISGIHDMIQYYLFYFYLHDLDMKNTKENQSLRKTWTAKWSKIKHCGPKLSNRQRQLGDTGKLTKRQLGDTGKLTKINQAIQNNICVSNQFLFEKVRARAKAKHKSAKKKKKNKEKETKQTR